MRRAASDVLLSKHTSDMQSGGLKMDDWSIARLATSVYDVSACSEPLRTNWPVLLLSAVCVQHIKAGFRFAQTHDVIAPVRRPSAFE